MEIYLEYGEMADDAVSPFFLLSYIRHIKNVKKIKKRGKNMIKEKFLSLVSAYKDDEDVLDIVKNDIQAVGEYVNAVYMMETTIPILRTRFDGQKLRDRIEKLDSNRRFCHDRAIMGVKRLNRFAKMEGLEPIFSGDTDDRYQIADFCRDTMVEIFDGRTGKGILVDQVIADSRERLDDEAERD